MKSSYLVAGVVISALCSGCSQSVLPTSPTSVPGLPSLGATSGELADAERSGGPAKAVPFKGQLEGTATVTPLDPPFGAVHVTATGNATHLGRFALEIPHVVNFATSSATGTITFTAANGDTLVASFTGQAQVTGTIAAIVETATVTGGSGRFAGAAGSFTINRVFDRVARTTHGTIEGTISVGH